MTALHGSPTGLSSGKGDSRQTEVPALVHQDTPHPGRGVKFMTVVAWSQRLERAVGGNMRAVIDTSRNGNGPYTGPDSPRWCNPPGRAQGPDPTLEPDQSGISAYLWIKDPGVSDGPCNGGPAAGQFWPAYALELARAGHFS